MNLQKPSSIIYPVIRPFHGWERETLDYLALPNADVKNAYVINDWIKDIKSGIAKIIPLATAVFSNTTTRKFVTGTSIDLRFIAVAGFRAIFTDINLETAHGNGVSPGTAEIFSDELLSNIDMELNSYWLLLGAAPSTAAQSNEKAHTGTYSWKMVNGTNHSADGIVSPPITIEAGGAYRLTSNIYPVATQYAGMGIYNGETGSDTPTQFSTLSPDEWNYKTTTRSFLEGGSLGAAYWLSYSMTSKTRYIDKVSMKQYYAPDAWGFYVDSWTVSSKFAPELISNIAIMNI